MVTKAHLAHYEPIIVLNVNNSVHVYPATFANACLTGDLALSAAIMKIGIVTVVYFLDL